MEQPLVAIVILNYNGRNYLERFLPSVFASTYSNKKIIIADNASLDDSVQFVQSHFPTAQVLLNTVNDGFAGGYNWALKHVDADYYILLNSDVEVTAGWIEPVIKLMEADKQIAACQPKFLSFHQPQLFEYAGAGGGWIDSLGYPFSKGRVFDVLEVDNHQYDSAELVFWASGAAMFVRSGLFHELHGFDEGFFAHQEEIDLCWRMQLAGYKIMACPQSVVYHVGAGTLPRGGRKVFLNFRNNLIMMSRNLPVSEMCWKLPLRFMLDGISAWKGLFSGDVSFFKAIVRAHWAVLIWWLKGNKKYPADRKSLKQLTGVYSGSIVWKHFVEHKKYFHEIVEKKRG